MVSSAYTRSVKQLRPTLIPGCVHMHMIQSMAMQKRAGARVHPCLSPNVVQNLSNANSNACGFVQGCNEIERIEGHLCYAMSSGVERRLYIHIHLPEEVNESLIASILHYFLLMGGLLTAHDVNQ